MFLYLFPNPIDVRLEVVVEVLVREFVLLECGYFVFEFLDAAVASQFVQHIECLGNRDDVLQGGEGAVGKCFLEFVLFYPRDLVQGGLIAPIYRLPWVEQTTLRGLPSFFNGNHAFYAKKSISCEKQHIFGR